ncbi:MAG: M20 family metallo-hydrolase, partial [Sporomusaceae bacterium]|nr:M20 family metallo-hydrolase [Sporomusaceae bacterium]
SDATAPVVATGSHIDTVPAGGKYDGVAGVVASLLAVKKLQAKGQLTHPVEVIVFACEEAGRFGFATIGSKVMTGSLPIHTWKKAVDKQGITLPEALATQGLSIENLGSAARSRDEFKCFLELHIEQGAILETAKEKIGLVTAIAAPTRLKVTIEGQAAHSGATPMECRRDALVSAAKIILAVREIALEQSYCGTVGTVGMATVLPGAMNIVPGKVELGIDIRGVDSESILTSIQDLKDFISNLAEEEETPVAIDVLTSDRPVQLDKKMIGLLEGICRRKKAAYRQMHSGAGHDAMHMAKLTPTAMIFIPCKEGISHNPAEYAATEDILYGVEILTEALYEQAK